MSLVDGGLASHGVLELCTWRQIPSHGLRGITRRSTLRCNAKSKVNDEQKNEPSDKGFSIRVPSIPKLGDSESARRLLESAFQALSFEMPKLPIESALQGLTFDISRFSIPKQIFIFDLRGFVATTLRKPPQEVSNTSMDEGLYPRCAWPRTSKGAHVGATAGTGEELQPQDTRLKSLLEQSSAAYPHCKWPRATLQTRRAEAGNEASLGGRPAAVSMVGIHGKDWIFPHSAWPRRSTSGRSVFSGTPELILESSSTKEEASSVIQGGARCAWPRKTIIAKQSCFPEKTADVSENPQVNVLGGEGSGCGKKSPADTDVVAALPRRMLAASVGLTMINQLARGSFILTSSVDIFSLLPAGSLEIAEEEEDATLDLGRRTLMVLLKN